MDNLTSEKQGPLCPSSTGSSSKSSEQRNTNTLKQVPSQADFTVIWNNLSYKVDSRPWYTKAKERFFTSKTRPNIDGNVSPRSKQEKVILNHVSGDVKTRQLTAIMGPSGAGKSSLLYCLFQNRTAGTTGQILVESQSKSKLKVCFIPQLDYLNEWLTVREDLIFVSKLKLARINGLLRDTSTATFSSSRDSNENYNDSFVRQHGQECRTSLIDHEANALCVAELLGLNNCLDVSIKNISGGQKKRLSIARELMSKPDILILDEPTTGLDSLTCYKTIMVLRDLALHSPNPMAVIVTIHQPQREVFNLFDKTYFISSTGRVIYDDSPKNAENTIKEVAKLKLPLPNYNPASFLIEIAADELQGSVIERLSMHQQARFVDKYDSLYLRRLMQSKAGYSGQNWKFCAVDDRNSACSYSSSPPSPTQTPFITESSQIEEFNLTDTTAIKMINSQRDIELDSEQYFISRQLSNCLSSHSNNLIQSFRHVFILTHRSWLSLIRNPTFTKTRFAFHTLLPFMMLLVFGSSMGVPNNCPRLVTRLSISDMRSSIKDGVIGKNVDETRLSLENMSFFFILMYGFGINIISSTASFYPLTIRMFKKEKINGLYSAAPYFVGQMLAELPLEIFFPSISILLSYPLSGQIPSYLEWRMFSVAYVVFLVSYVIHSLGLLCGSIFVNNVSVALLLGQGLLLPLVMLSGFVVRPARMSDLMRKLAYTSPFKHGITAIIAARYGFNVCDCDEEQLAESGGTVRIGGMTPHVKNVLKHLFPRVNSSSSTGDSTSETRGLDVDITEMFDKLSQRFVKAQTFSLEMKTCADVRPYLMHVLDVQDSDLFVGIGCLLLTVIVLKLVTFSIMKSFPYRTN